MFYADLRQRKAGSWYAHAFLNNQKVFVVFQVIEQKTSSAERYVADYVKTFNIEANIFRSIHIFL